MRGEWPYQLSGYAQPAGDEGRGRYIYGHAVAGSNGLYAPYMVAMLVADEDGLYLLHTQLQPPHAFLGFAKGQAGIYQHSFVAIAHIVAIAITARIE